MSQEWDILNKFSRVMPRVHYVSLQEDGELTGYVDRDLQNYGWNIPNKGDRLMTLHDPPDYTTSVVHDRIFIEEGFGDDYWLIVLKNDDNASEQYLDAVANHMWLVTDYERANFAGDPEENLIARAQQLSGQPSGRMRIQPKSRDPEPDRGWDEDDDDTP